MQEALSGTVEGKWQFFLTVGGKRLDLQVGMDRDGSRCLRGKDDHTDESALLNLPECDYRRAHKDDVLGN